MSDRVLIPLPGVGTLALSAEVYQAALEEGASLSPKNHLGAASSTNSSEPLMDADALAAQLSIPATWIEQKAREGVIPSIEFGRWRRFRRSDVEAAAKAMRS